MQRDACHRPRALEDARGLDAATAAREPLIRREPGLLQDHGNHDQVYQINRNAVSAATTAILENPLPAQPLLGIA